MRVRTVGETVTASSICRIKGRLIAGDAGKEAFTHKHVKPIIGGGFADFFLPGYVCDCNQKKGEKKRGSLGLHRPSDVPHSQM